MASPRKSVSSVNVEAEKYRSNGSVNVLTPASRKSCESLYSTASSKPSTSAIYRCKMPTNIVNRQPAIIPAATEVQKRVISARRLRFKSVQNQLGLAQHTITELSNENRMLRNLLKRQDSALAKYESNNAELPRLLHAHTEELRAWKTKYCTLQVAHKEQEQKLKQKEAIILTLGDENKYYSQLIKDKNLEDRQRLAERLLCLEALLQEKENQMKIAERKSQLEMKNLKQQLQNEQKKTRDVLQKLEKARLELSNYEKAEELNTSEKLSSTSIKQSASKNSRKPFKGKPYGGSTMHASKTPSPPPAVDAVSIENDDSDCLVSNRSRKSGSSSLNMDHSTTRTTVRKKTSFIDKKHSVPKANGSERIDDETDRMKTSEEQISRKPMKMMVNMPGFDSEAGGDASQASEEDAGMSMGSDIDYNYHDGHDDYDDDAKVSNHELSKKFHYEGLIPGEDYQDDDDDEVTESPDRTRDNVEADGYKGREAFLDTFCGKDSRTTLGSNEKEVNDNIQVAASRKNRLIAALKAIDDDQFSSQV